MVPRCCSFGSKCSGGEQTIRKALSFSPCCRSREPLKVPRRITASTAWRKLWFPCCGRRRLANTDVFFSQHEFFMLRKKRQRSPYGSLSHFVTPHKNISQCDHLELENIRLREELARLRAEMDAEQRRRESEVAKLHARLEQSSNTVYISTEN